jgi:hypothetical protein
MSEWCHQPAASWGLQASEPTRPLYLNKVREARRLVRDFRRSNIQRIPHSYLSASVDMVSTRISAMKRIGYEMEIPAMRCTG